MTPSPRKLTAYALLIGLSGVVLACASGPAAAPAPEPLPRGDEPSLVVLIVVDQMRGDYLERFRPVLRGGLAWLVENGVVYTDAHHEHAATATAPGHATIATGLAPAAHGVIGNSWFNRETGLPEYSAGISSTPENLIGTALGDWLKAADPRSRVFAASGKDRSAVMMGGRQPDAAYWYGRREGDWISSSYYTRADRPWLAAFNEQDWLGQFRGVPWTPRLSPDQAVELGIVELDTGVLRWGFPHVLGSYSVHRGSSYYGDIYGSPFVDSYLAEFGKALIDNEWLGADGSPDLLALSFSALDTVGHTYGPDSAEALDVVVRLDEALDDLIRHIDQTVGLDHVVFALSADHGVVTFPEVRQSRNEPGKRIDVDDIVCVQQADRALREHYGDADWLQYGLYLDHELIAERGEDRVEMAARLADYLETCDAVERAWTETEIAAIPPTTDDPVARRMRANYFPSRGPDVELQLKPHYLYYNSLLGTTHGSPYDYDSWVPIILAAPGMQSAVIDRRVATVDIAPTLAAILGIETPVGLDGDDLSADLQPRAVTAR